MSVRAGNAHPLGALLEYPHRVAARKLCGRLCEFHLDEFAGQAMAHEDDSTVIEASDSSPGRRPKDSNHDVPCPLGLVAHRVSLLKPLGHEQS